MTQRVVILCTPPVAAGFRLTGADVVALAAGAAGPGPSEVLAALGPLVADPEVGVVLIQGELYERLGVEARRFERDAVPMILPFPGPGPELAGAAERTISDVLAQAIGYRVRAG